MSLPDVTAQLLDCLQRHWPLTPTPFAAFGDTLGVSEEDVLQRVRALKEERIIRQIGPIFDTKSLGYASSLVAMQVAPERLEAAAAVVSTHPGVSHNYAREHEFNLWFTIAVPPDSTLGLDKTVDLLHALAGAESTRLLPTLRLFKIGVRLNMGGGQDTKAPEPTYSEADQATDLPPLTERDKTLVRITQRPLEIVSRPFDAQAADAHVSTEELLDWLSHMKAQGRMRRFAAVLHHRKAGFTANGMGVWAVPEERITEVGERLAAYAAVSHCYHRPSYADWAYNIFTMVHGRSREEVETLLAEMGADCSVSERGVLYSTTEFKKVRLTYFTAELAEWERRHTSAG